MPITKFDDFERYHPETRQAWREWLRANGEKSPGVWFVYYKKAAGKPRVSYDEAVEEALCFGWIDSLPRKLDDEKSMLIFTPRKPNSGWSRLNKQRIEKLIRENLMTAAGLRKIEAAKADGSWEKLDKIESLEMPADLEKALNANKVAAKNFAAFGASVKKGIFWWIESAKRTETRGKRVDETIAMAAENKRAVYDKK